MSQFSSLPLPVHDWLQLRTLTGWHLKPGGVTLCQEALGVCHFPAHARLADVGCGLGGTLHFLSQRAFHCLGVDSNPHILAQGRALVPHVPVLQADMHSLPLSTASMDGLLYECVLTLAADMPRALREACRVLRSGGTLIVSDLFVRHTEQTPTACAKPTTFACTQGALSLPLLCETIQQAGFDIVYQSDHTKALRELAAQWAWHKDSPLNATSVLPACTQGKKFGYTLLIALKHSIPNREEA